jgi:hypothetical protein
VNIVITSNIILVPRNFTEFWENKNSFLAYSSCEFKRCEFI